MFGSLTVASQRCLNAFNQWYKFSAIHTQPITTVQYEHLWIYIQLEMVERPHVSDQAENYHCLTTSKSKPSFTFSLPISASLSTAVEDWGNSYPHMSKQLSMPPDDDENISSGSQSLLKICLVGDILNNLDVYIRNFYSSHGFSVLFICAAVHAVCYLLLSYLLHGGQLYRAMHLRSCQCYYLTILYSVCVQMCWLSSYLGWSPTDCLHPVLVIFYVCS